MKTLEYEMIESIKSVVDDDQSRQVYADWLEEVGDVKRAEFVRAELMVESSNDQNVTVRANQLNALANQVSDQEWRRAITSNRLSGLLLSLRKASRTQ